MKTKNLVAETMAARERSREIAANMKSAVRELVHLARIHRHLARTSFNESMVDNITENLTRARLQMAAEYGASSRAFMRSARIVARKERA